MPKTEWGWLITPSELASWIVFEDSQLLVINKPGLVLCHPSKHGPWSSLIGACREYLGLDRLHMPSRLDRETSGVVVLAKNAVIGSLLQRAVQHRKVKKKYRAILQGELHSPVLVEQPIGKAEGCLVAIKQGVMEGGYPAVTRFIPLRYGNGYTLAEIEPCTGRMHQIRVHASWLGYPIVGDKIYGPDESLFLEFLETGWTPQLADRLKLERQALHALEWTCCDERMAVSFQAPMAADWEAATQFTLGAGNPIRT